MNRHPWAGRAAVSHSFASVSLQNAKFQKSCCQMNTVIWKTQGFCWTLHTWLLCGLKGMWNSSSPSITVSQIHSWWDLLSHLINSLSYNCWLDIEYIIYPIYFLGGKKNMSFQTVIQAAEYCKNTGIPFPPVEIPEEDRKQPKDFYDSRAKILPLSSTSHSSTWSTVKVSVHFHSTDILSLELYSVLRLCAPAQSHLFT